jgi:hypothetical protein
MIYHHGVLFQFEHIKYLIDYQTLNVSFKKFFTSLKQE